MRPMGVSEDAILGRDLNSMEEVADLMYLAYQAGKKGEVMG